MCGRYTIAVTMEELMVRYFANDSTIIHYAPKYNAAPMQQIPAVINTGSGNKLGELRWGLVPAWAKDNKKGVINARAETLLEKPSFTIPFLRKRCLIPANSFFEWQTTASGKQPMRIMLKSEAIFSFAGIYDTWIAPDGQKSSSVAIITTEPNALVEKIHNRMPVILKPEDEATWLDRSLQNPTTLMSLLQPYSAEEMTAYPVSPEVGNVRNNTPNCIKEIY